MVKTDNKHPNRLYPWEKWFKNNTFTLHKGKDFDCLAYSMQMMLRRNARLRGLVLQTRMSKDGNSMVCTVVKRSKKK